MTRLELTTSIAALTGLKVFPISDFQGGRETEWLVLKYGGGVGSSASSNGVWEFWTVLAYTARNSIPTLDSVIGAIEAWASTPGVGVEYTGNTTPDFYDEELSALTRSIQIRIPKEV